MKLKKLVSKRALPYVTTPVIIVLFLAVWSWAVWFFKVSPFVLPSPGAIGEALVKQLADPKVWTEHIWTTFYETFFGFVIALLVGASLGFLIGKFETFAAIMRPFIVAIQVIPKVALVPLFILWLGFGPESKILISAMIAFFVILTNTSFGVRSIPKVQRELMRSLSASKLQEFRKLEFPYTLSYILAGAETGIVLAYTGAIVGEYLAGEKGLGRYAINLQNALNVPGLFGAIAIMALLGFVLYRALLVVKHFAIPWHDSVRLTNSRDS